MNKLIALNAYMTIQFDIIELRKLIFESILKQKNTHRDDTPTETFEVCVVALDIYLCVY